LGGKPAVTNHIRSLNRDERPTGTLVFVLPLIASNSFVLLAVFVPDRSPARRARLVAAKG
jgi:hypothetical protein